MEEEAEATEELVMWKPQQHGCLRWNSNHILPVTSGVKRMDSTQSWSGVTRGIFTNFSFIEQFQVHTNIAVEVQRFSTDSLTVLTHRLPIINISTSPARVAHLL